MGHFRGFPVRCDERLVMRSPVVVASDLATRASLGASTVAATLLDESPCLQGAMSIISRKVKWR
jgi:hypothetical protein